MTDLKFIMHKNASGKFDMYACRGEGKGCHRNKFRDAKKPCEDCLLCDNPNETLGEIQARLAKGDG